MRALLPAGAITTPQAPTGWTSAHIRSPDSAPIPWRARSDAHSNLMIRLSDVTAMRVQPAASAGCSRLTTTRGSNSHLMILELARSALNKRKASEIYTMRYPHGPRASPTPDARKPWRVGSRGRAAEAPCALSRIGGFRALADKAWERMRRSSNLAAPGARALRRYAWYRGRLNMPGFAGSTASRMVRTAANSRAGVERGSATLRARIMSSPHHVPMRARPSSHRYSRRIPQKIAANFTG